MGSVAIGPTVVTMATLFSNWAATCANAITAGKAINAKHLSHTHTDQQQREPSQQHRPLPSAACRVKMAVNVSYKPMALTFAPALTVLWEFIVKRNQ